MSATQQQELGFDIQAAIALAAEQGDDLHDTSSGGGDYVPPAEGIAMVRFVGYIELGAHTVKGVKGAPDKDREKAKFIFELHGKNYPYREVEGKQLPQTISFDLPISKNEKANYIKLFNQMNYERDINIKVFPQLLGRGFLARVVHDKWTPPGGGERIIAKLRDDNGFTIQAAVINDPVTGETRPVPVPPVLSQLRLFLWNFPSKPMWDSLYIPGEYEEEKDEKGNVKREARSKNVYQDTIRKAKNFPGSPIAEILLGDLDLGDAETTARSEADVQASVEAKAGAAADPTEGI
ncbi:hypothetical protein FDH29_gp24 [Aquamicrobium phage P14]|uniref:Uncharacterized protein n=1 Tax=Aquamicrobium phage P14 TaxID=1927013 RepID=A0A1L5C049_9CAUD|nr:hypothetical protein FDH29_gp24 [Aquamicrobium phage P14]APL99482.1 hypothetical protein BB738_0240 [Aquamicrobium phage P14]